MGNIYFPQFERMALDWCQTSEYKILKYVRIHIQAYTPLKKSLSVLLTVF